MVHFISLTSSSPVWSQNYLVLLLLTDMCRIQSKTHMLKQMHDKEGML